ncbi:MAG: CAP domain-containing protein [Ardenticatenaceae bacterium]|nr:CAP domain-containing protein [Ardenticatenaceae bacterium]
MKPKISTKVFWITAFSLGVLFIFTLSKVTLGENVEPTATLEPRSYLPIAAKDPTPTPTITPTPTATPEPGCVPPPEIPASDLINEEAILSGINQQRSNNSLPALALAGELTQSSRRHSLDMAENHFTGHTGSDGSVVGDRMLDACYEWNYRGEIIGWGFGGDTSAMLDWWMNSQPHRETILNVLPEDFGVGYIRLPGSDWTHYWTVNFGRRSTAVSGGAQALYFCEYVVEGEQGGASVRYYSATPCPVYD